MTPLRRAGAVAVALVLALSWAVGGAGAQPAPKPWKVVFDTPGDGEVVQRANPTIAVHVPLDVVTIAAGPPALQLTVRSLDPGKPQPPQPHPEPLRGVACQEVRFENVVLPSNGHYELTVTAPVDQLPDVTASDSHCSNLQDARRFFMAAPPAAPTGVKAVSKAPETITTVAWSRNPEPDVVRYKVLRAKGTDAFVPLRETPGTSLIDATTATGGEFSYEVIALRHGARPDDPLIESPASAPSDKVTIAVPIPPSSVGAGGARRAIPQLPPLKPKYNTPGETGFSETLPFAGGAQLSEEPGSEQAQPVQGLGASDSRSGSRRSLALLAAGLLATVLAMHLLWVKSEVDREPLEVLGPD